MIATAVLAAQYAGTLELLDATKIDARATQPLPILQSPHEEIALAADISTMPLARLRLSDRRWDYSLTYSPSFSVTDIELISQAQPLVLNTGIASVAWHDHFVRVMVSESASYGLENLGYIYDNTGQGTAGQAGAGTTGIGTGTGVGTGTGTGTGTGVGTGTGTGVGMGAAGMATSTSTSKSSTLPQWFTIGASNTSASVTLRATRQVTLLVSGGYSVSGNLSNNANNPNVAVVLPEQFGPFGAASVVYAVSKSDSLVTLASAQETTTPLGECFPPRAVGQYCRQVEPILQVQETLRHRLSTTATISLNVGAAAAIQQLTTEKANETAWVILPTGGLTFTDRVGAIDNRDASTLTLSAQVGPVVDVNSGGLDNLVQTNAILKNPVAPNVFLSFTAGLLQSIPPDPSPLTALNGGVDLRFRMTRQVDVSLGVQGFWQRQAFYGAVPVATTMGTAVAAGTTAPTTTASEIGYVMLTARLPTLHF